MKRIGNLYGKIASLENLYLADRKARKGKGHQPGVVLHSQNWEANLYSLHHALLIRTYKTSPYTVFTIHEPKEREIFRLPYFPDRILHHAVMNVLEPIFAGVFTADSYSCIKGRGIHGAANAVKRSLRNPAATRYCLKLDIRKFYPSVSHGVLKSLLQRKFKDPDLLWLLEEIVDSAPGLPIGNYLSQYFANFYLTYFDHRLKEDPAVRGLFTGYFRYLDDMVFLGPDKPSLHRLLAFIRRYLRDELRLEVKDNYQVFPVDARGIDFVGYVFFHTHTRLRKSIKKNFARKMAKSLNLASIASYYGWTKHCNGNHLLKRLINEKFQRNGDQSDLPTIRRRQDQNGTAPEPGDNGSLLQVRRLQQKGRNQMPLPADHAGKRETGHFHQRPGLDGSDPKSPRDGLPLHHNDRETK